MVLVEVVLAAVAPEEDGKMPNKFQMKDLKCPRCNILMDKVTKKDVIIDVCKKCNGLWLDDQEINKLVQLAQGDKNEK